MTKYIALAAVFLFFAFQVHTGYAQYFGERVLEKSFEHTDFFFTPSYVVPYGIATFRSTMVWLLDDPLLNLAVNPSNFYKDSLNPHYVYADLRSPGEIRTADQSIYPVIPYYELRTMYSPDIIRPYPFFFVRTRKEIEPTVSLAYLTRPLRAEASRLFLGATYQLIIQDEKYYPIPQDIYRPVVGYDYLGFRVAAESQIPIIDRFTGTDNIQHLGHFASMFGGYEVSDDLRVGIKISRVLFDRDGNFGSSNFWEYTPQSTNRSLWSSLEARDQRYRHWDVAAGVNYRLVEDLTGGLTVGYLRGNAPQTLTREDSSFSGNGQINVGTDWSYYWNAGSTLQQWDHQGRVVYGGLNLSVALTNTQTLHAVYSAGRENTDITLSSSILDTSYSNYRWTYQDTIISRGLSEYRLSDLRSGIGTREGFTHRFVAALQWNIEPQVNMSLGLQLDVQDRKTRTSEGVIAVRRSLYSSSSTGSWPYSYSGFHRASEEKTLRWDFETSLTRVQIPFILRWRTSDIIELFFGINRRMSRWQIKETTLALFKYQELTQDSVTTRRTNFGERYVTPTERTSDVETAFLGGLAVSPSDALNIRFLVVPTVREVFDDSRVDLRWWIAMNVLPK
jgi:hypothetical protein